MRAILGASLSAALALMLTCACARQLVQPEDDSDPAIRARIETRIQGLSDLDLSHVTIDVYSRVVTVTGVVPNDAQRAALRRIIYRVPGVEQIIENLVVADYTRVRAALLRWYRRERRDLPWRREVSPYRTWVSEIMLQQTTVAAVTPKYEAFLRRFPHIAALSAASEDDVLAAWAGLGYYSRARNLRRAAREIVEKRGGRFPSDFESVLALPGIGRYTAGAILSIAFGKPYPVVDGNVIRVFARLFGLRGRAKDPAFAARIWERAEKLVPKSSPGDWNQALMELGATICTPESPSCGACPVAKECVAYKKGVQDALPLPEKRRTPEDVHWTCLWIERDGEVLLWKRTERERLLKNLWGLPEAGRVPAAPGRRLARVAHTITYHALTVDLREGALAPGAVLPPQARWTTAARAKERLVSSLWLKLLKARA